MATTGAGRVRHYLTVDVDSWRQANKKERFFNIQEGRRYTIIKENE